MLILRPVRTIDRFTRPTTPGSYGTDSDHKAKGPPIKFETSSRGSLTSLLRVLSDAPISERMRIVYRIGYAKTAPRLRVINSPAVTPELLDFNGESKRSTWPMKGGLLVEADATLDIRTFYFLAPGALVYRDSLLVKFEDFYWVSREGAEVLPLRCGDVSFEAVNIVDFLKPPHEPNQPNLPPCPVDKHYSAVFRIAGRPKTDLFCVSGVAGVDLNEFKGVYDHCGFEGLTFTEIWRGEE
jgi:hypothetical protein